MNRMGTIITIGGGDCPEDLCGGLRAASRLVWTANTRLAVVLTDAPCHGMNYHLEPADDYPQGDPKGDTPEVLIEKLHQLGVQVCFVRVEQAIDRMTGVLVQVAYFTSIRRYLL